MTFVMSRSSATIWCDHKGTISIPEPCRSKLSFEINRNSSGDSQIGKYLRSQGWIQKGLDCYCPSCYHTVFLIDGDHHPLGSPKLANHDLLKGDHDFEERPNPYIGTRLDDEGGITDSWLFVKGTQYGASKTWVTNNL